MVQIVHIIGSAGMCNLLLLNKACIIKVDLSVAGSTYCCCLPKIKLSLHYHVGTHRAQGNSCGKNISRVKFSLCSIFVGQSTVCRYFFVALITCCSRIIFVHFVGQPTVPTEISSATVYHQQIKNITCHMKIFINSMNPIFA